MYKLKGKTPNPHVAFKLKTKKLEQSHLSSARPETAIQRSFTECCFNVIAIPQKEKIKPKDKLHPSCSPITCATFFRKLSYIIFPGK